MSTEQQAMSFFNLLTTSPWDAIIGRRSSRKQHEPKAQFLLEQAILSGNVAGVEQSLAQGANAMESIDGRIPLCVAIRNGEDDVAISLLQHCPGRSLQPAAPHHEWAESLDRSLLRLGMSPLNDRYLKYCGKFLTQSLVILLLFQVPDVFFFKVSESPAVYIISTLVTEILYLLVRKCYENLSFHAAVVGAQAIDAFLDSESQSERLLLELLDRGLISSNSASLDQLWGVAADKGYAEATRRLAALRSAPESDNTRTGMPHPRERS